MPNEEKPPFPSLAEVAQRLEAEEKARKQEEAVTSLQPACLTDEVDIETWEAEFPSNLPAMRVPAQEEPKASGPGPSWNKTSFGDISQHCGITRQHAGYIMNGQRNPTVAVLRKMAGYFTMPMDELHARLEKTKTAPDGWLG